MEGSESSLSQEPTPQQDGLSLRIFFFNILCINWKRKDYI